MLGEIEVAEQRRAHGGLGNRDAARSGDRRERAGAEAGPGAVATQGVAVTDQAESFGFAWERSGQSSKHYAFDWTGPETP